MKTTLVIMAAGIGSRFGGGIKQLAPVGLNGEIIMDYSIHDAIEAGFNKIVFIIRKDIKDAFKEAIGDRIEKICNNLDVEIAYAYQELSELPESVELPAGRTKPWGTGQAVLACKEVLHEPFAVLKEIPSEENLWQAVIAFQDYPFKTATRLPFRYKLKVGKNGEYNRELLIDRREKSKSLAWSSVVLAFENSKRILEEVKKPKALGDIRGVSYIYPILWRLGLIRVPEAIEKKIGKQR